MWLETISFYVSLFFLSHENIFSTVVLAFSTWILVALHSNANVLTCATSSFRFVDFRFMVVGFEFDKPFYSYVQPINNIAEGWCLIPGQGRKRQSKLSIDSQTGDSVDKKWWKKGLGCINVDSRSFMSGRQSPPPHLRPHPNAFFFIIYFLFSLFLSLFNHSPFRIRSL